MANKTSKKTIAIEWPKGHFTIEEVWQKVGGKAVIPNITLRSRVNKAEDAKEIVLIGKVKPLIGRPKKVYAKANPSKEVLDTAKAAGVVFCDDSKPVNTSVTVAEVKTEKKTKVVVPTASKEVKTVAAPVVDHVPSVVSQ